MARLSTCKECGKKISSDEKKTYKNKSYCLDCYQNISFEHEQYKQLLVTISEVSKISINDFPPYIFKQIKDYKEDKNLTYGGMSYTLWYISEVLKREIKLQEYGLAIILYEYNNAKQWYNKQQKIQQSVENVAVTKMTVKTSKFSKIIPKSNYLNLDSLC